MKDRKIGEVFVHPRFGELKVVEEISANECTGCVFVSPICSNEPDRRHTGNCSMELRQDCMGVIFVNNEKGE